jgi:hypothetical protein
MALDLESQLRVFLASAPQTARVVSVFEIRHSAMTNVWYLWREPYAGTVTTEDDEQVAVLAANIGVEVAGSPANLDQVFKIAMDVTDVEDTFRAELDRIPLATTERVLLVYREYLSCDLTSPQAVADLQVESILIERGKVGFVATSPRLNVTRTGELYAPKAIPMLRGFL